MTMSRLKVLTLFALIGSVNCGPPGTTKAKDVQLDYNLTESEYLTLEGRSILPVKDTVAKVEYGLQQIRTKFPVISEIKHNRKWIPGQVLSTKITQEEIARVNSSKYGPLKNVEKIDVMPFFYVTVLTFNKAYSPPVLAELLELEFGFKSTPNTVYYEHEVDNIFYKADTSTYIFKRGTGLCNQPTCGERYLWEFSVNDMGDVTLLKEWAVPQNGERVVIY